MPLGWPQLAASCCGTNPHLLEDSSWHDRPWQGAADPPVQMGLLSLQHGHWALAGAGAELKLLPSALLQPGCQAPEGCVAWARPAQEAAEVVMLMCGRRWAVRIALWRGSDAAVKAHWIQNFQTQPKCLYWDVWSHCSLLFVIHVWLKLCSLPAAPGLKHV